MNCIRLDDTYRCFCSHVQPLFVCPKYMRACICENVFMCLRECKSCFWPVNLHLSLSPSSLQACRRWSVKASTAFPPSLRMPVVSSGVLQAQRQPTDAKEKGTEEDIELITTTAATNLRSGGTRGPIGITPSLTLTMLRRELCVSVYIRQDRGRQKHPETKRKRKARMREFKVGASTHRGKKDSSVSSLFFIILLPP